MPDATSVALEESQATSSLHAEGRRRVCAAIKRYAGGREILRRSVQYVRRALQRLTANLVNAAGDDDLHNDYFHTVSAQHPEAGLDANGKIVAWLHRAAEPTILSITGGP